MGVNFERNFWYPFLYQRRNSNVIRSTQKKQTCCFQFSQPRIIFFRKVHTILEYIEVHLTWFLLSAL